MTTGLKLAAIVLAAGAGTRFGGGKLTAEWGNIGVLLNGALSAAFAAPVQKIFVVVGADPNVVDAINAFTASRGVVDRVETVPADDWAEGLSMSIYAGMEALAASEIFGSPFFDGVYLFLGDMPRIPRSILQPLAQALDDGAFAAAPVFHSRRGHPVLFSRVMFAELMTLEGDRGAGELLDGLGDGLVTIPAPDDGVLFDVDERS